jgi:hypothetical protein
MTRLPGKNEKTNPVIPNQALIDQSSPDSEPFNKQRRALIGGALFALLSSPKRVAAEEKAVPKDPFVFLLKGVYQPVVPGTGPDLGLSRAGVNLNDGSYVKTQIYPVHIEGIPCGSNEKTAVGTFFVQANGSLCAYQLAEGTIAMQFASCWNFDPGVPDGLGGVFLNGIFELTILEATGIYRSFQGGHNHMEDRLHQLADGNFDEYCFCFISRR